MQMYFVLNPCNFGVYTSNIGFVRMSPRMLFFILSRFRVTSHQDSGHSFLSKFLVTAVPWSMFSGNSNILPAVLEEIATCFCKLFDHGVELGNEKFYFAVIGVKGDAEFHVDCGYFTRSYQTVGEVSDIPMCPYCDAVTSNFGDVSDYPCWLDSAACTQIINVFCFGPESFEA